MFVLYFPSERCSKWLLTVLFVEIMPDKKIEQRINLKLLMIIEKSARESLCLLADVYEDPVMSLARVFEWHRQFLEGCIEVEDEQHVGRPCTKS